jgi:hypothetical protein
MAGLSLGPRILGASSLPRRTVDPSVAGPNLYRIMMWPPFQHRVRPINCFEERARINLLMGFDVIATIEKMASVEGHKVLSPFITKAARRGAAVKPVPDLSGK